MQAVSGSPSALPATSGITNAAPLVLRREGDCLRLVTGDSILRRSRLLARLGGAGMAISGLVGALMIHPALCLLVPLGLVIALMIPDRLHTQEFLEVNETNHTIRSLQTEIEPAAPLPIQDIAAIEGLYQTQGWDGFSRIYATQQNGTQILLLHLRGTDERMAETTCALLGALLHCPATYVGPFGEEKICHIKA